MLSVFLGFILFAIRTIAIGIALGILFIKLRLFSKMSNGQVMIIGLASTPMFISLANYLLGLIFIGWSNYFFYLVPLVGSIVWIVLFRNYIILISAVKDIYAYFMRIISNIRKWFLLDLLLSLCIIFIATLFYNNPKFVENYVKPMFGSYNMIGILFGLAFLICIVLSLVVIAKKMLNDGTFETNIFVLLFLIMSGWTLFFGMSYNSFHDGDPDHAHYQLEARYFSQTKNSWEIDNYKDERYGSSMRDDHGPLWITFIADGQLISEIVGIKDPVRICNLGILETFCCFYFLMFFSASYISHSNKAGILTILLFELYKKYVYMIFGSRDAFRFVGLLLLFLYVGNFIFDVIEKKEKKYQYLFIILFCYFSMNGHAGNSFIMLGLFIAVSVMLILYKVQISKLIFCGICTFIGTAIGSIKTLQIYIDTGNLSADSKINFIGTPIMDSIKKAEEQRVFAPYSLPVVFSIIIGITGLITLIIVSIKHKNKRMLVLGLLVAGMLLPMTGIMNWVGYNVSLYFYQNDRYRLYFLMLLSISGSWLLSHSYSLSKVNLIKKLLIIILIIFSATVGYSKISNYDHHHMESSNIESRVFQELADKVDLLTDGDVFTNNQVILYYLHGTPKLLVHPYCMDLIQAKTNYEIEKALDDLHVAALLLPTTGYGIDARDYSTLPFWYYINSSETFEKIEDTGGSKYTIYINTKATH